ncbi:hypothetical protein [Streptomyces sp. NPDC048603]|uniref:hypothetical protein n=1 Tax=Streptomyces sp. NPDC048603 TaxID=3365577 RepID=UPI0037176807
MDAVRVALLREVLAGTEWPGAARRFAGTLRRSVVPSGGGLLLVGTEEYEPWHLAAHLTDEAAWSGLPELVPTLVRHRVPPGGPSHLSVGLGRLEASRRGETLLVVAPERPPAGLLERVHGARRAGATVLSLDGGDAELSALAHEALSVPAGADPALDPARALDLDTVQHLVSAAAGENTVPARRGPRRTGADPARAKGGDRGRDRLARLAGRW